MKMKFENLTLSDHLRSERSERVTKILMTVGLGNPIIRLRENDHYVWFTDTGVMVLVNKAETLIITLYMAQYNKAYALFKENGYSCVEGKLGKIIKRCEKKYSFLYK